MKSEQLLDRCMRMLNDLPPTLKAACVVCLCLILIAGATSCAQHWHIRALKRRLFAGFWMTPSDFERLWITKHGASGLKHSDGPGCYVFLVFDHPVVNNNFKNYQEVYVGQSVHVFARIHQHLSGKGNGDLYADKRLGRYLYISVNRCPKDALNVMEKQLIATFGARTSYNKTLGGAKITYENHLLNGKPH